MLNEPSDDGHQTRRMEQEREVTVRSSAWAKDWSRNMIALLVIGPARWWGLSGLLDSIMLVLIRSLNLFGD